MIQLMETVERIEQQQPDEWTRLLSRRPAEIMARAAYHVEPSAFLDWGEAQYDAACICRALYELLWQLHDFTPIQRPTC